MSLLSPIMYHQTRTAPPIDVHNSYLCAFLPHHCSLSHITCTRTLTHHPHTKHNHTRSRLKYHVLCGSVIISHPRKYDTMLSALMREGR